MVFDKGAFAIRIEQTEGVNWGCQARSHVLISGLQDERVSLTAKALHHSVASRDGPVRENPHLHMGGLWVEAHKVPCIVVSGLSGRDLIVRFWLDGVDEIDEFDGILNEENGHVVADDIPTDIF
jgi:hypothetical protein